MNKKERDIEKMKKYPFGCGVKISRLNMKCAYRSLELNRTIQHAIDHWKWIKKAPKRNKVQYYEVYENNEAKPDQVKPAESLRLPEKNSMHELQADTHTIQGMQHNYTNVSAPLDMDTTQNQSGFLVSKCGTSREEVFDRAETTSELSSEGAMCMSPLFETPQKGPVVNNDPNFNDAIFLSPM